MSTPSTLAPAFDLLAAYEPGGLYFERRGLDAAGGDMLGLGVAGGAAGVDVEIGDVARVLSAAPAGAAAVGALPFEGGGALRLPARLVRRTRSDRGRPTLIGPPRDFTRVRGGAPEAAFAAGQRHPIPEDAGYAAAVAELVDRIGRTDLRKVVLARTVAVDAGRPLDPVRLAHRLRAVDPEAYTFAAPVPGGTIVGASPELLVSRFGREVQANPLAGTAPRSGDRDEDRANADRLLSSSKDREEHAIVVEAIAEILAPLCEPLTYDPEPRLRETPNVWHLSTRFAGFLREPWPTALELALALHPTPAVAGTPTPDALAAIAELEPFDRSAYAGPVGWVDARGDGAFAIALRCAILEGDRATLFAGAGIVEGSVPAAELDETERKFRAFLDALRWG